MYSIIEELRSNNSRNFKEETLKKHSESRLIEKVLYYTLSPRKQFYVRKIPKYTTCYNRSMSLDNSFDVLDTLHNRNVTGHAAIELVKETLSSLEESDAKVFELILSKDLKCGVNTSTVNKVFPGLIEETPYQRCSLLKDMNKDKISWEQGLYSQEKLDGMFANVVVGEKESVFSRNGSSFPIEPFRDIIDDLQQFLHEESANLVFHGEIVVYYNDELLKREVGNGVLNSLLKTGEFDSSQYRIHFVVWDCLDYEEFFEGRTSSAYHKRFHALENITPSDETNVSLCPTRIVYSFEEAKRHYKELASLGKEGTILKDSNSIWKDGTSKQMWKFKVEAEAELRVVGFTEGNGKNKDLFGSIQCISEDSLLEVNVSGFSDDQRKEISDNRELYLDKIVSVVYNNIMKPEGKKASMFLPRFKEWRFDKDKANTLEEIEDIFESVLES